MSDNINELENIENKKDNNLSPTFSSNQIVSNKEVLENFEKNHQKNKNDANDKQIKNQTNKEKSQNNFLYYLMIFELVFLILYGSKLSYYTNNDKSENNKVLVVKKYLTNEISYVKSGERIIVPYNFFNIRTTLDNKNLFVKSQNVVAFDKNMNSFENLDVNVKYSINDNMIDKSYVKYWAMHKNISKDKQKIEYINSYNHIELNLLQSVYKTLSTFDINSTEFNQMKFEDLVRIDLQKRLNALDDKMFILDKVEVNIIKKQNMETK